MGVIARESEETRLGEFFDSNKSEFMAVYGRRRVGKTYLINHYFRRKNCLFLSFTGIHEGHFQVQREAFCAELSRQYYKDIPLETPKDWFEIFELLDKVVQSTKKKVVLFLDEFPWMSTPRSKLLQVIEYFWNQRWSLAGNVKLIICGSLASWIIRNIIENTGGLYHRVTYRLAVEPFTLKQTKIFLEKQNHVDLTPWQILKLYIVMGGIPLYLEQAKKGKSAEKVIDEVCFNREGLLFDEMNELFKSLFKESKIYMDITREISQYRYGIEKQKLAKKLKLRLGGHFSLRLKELEEAGFITANLPYGHKEKGIFYRISDEYTMFYFSWIEPQLTTIKRFTKPSGYWQQKAKESDFIAWHGYTFETICYKHLAQIAQALELSTTSIPYTWKYTPQPGKKEEGAQIDLLFDSPDDTITVCEIKCTKEPFVIDKHVAETLKKKIETFRTQDRIKSQIFFALISAQGIKESKYSKTLVSSVVTLEDLFC